MFERFAKSARQVVIGAQEEARSLGHHFVGTEHLLLAMFEDGASVVDTVLTRAGVRQADLRVQVQRHVAGELDPLGPEAVAALESIGIDLNAVRERIEESFGPGALQPVPPPRRRWFRGPGLHLPFTRRAKKVLELGVREAVLDRSRLIATEHLFLGLLREGAGMGARILADAGLDFAQLRREVLDARRQAA